MKIPKNSWRSPGNALDASVYNVALGRNSHDSRPLGHRRRPPARAGARPDTHACRFVPDGQAPTTRCGDRDWFSDRLFIESQSGHARSGFGTSVTVHLVRVGALIVFLWPNPTL
jgi:hypothetical protein